MDRDNDAERREWSKLVWLLAAHDPNLARDRSALLECAADNLSYNAVSSATLLRLLDEVEPIRLDVTVSSDALALARAAYEDSSVIGVLADALEEAGCKPPLVEHFRSPVQHVKGCWALDLILDRR